HPVAASPAEEILVPVVAHVAHGHAPLVGARDHAHVVGGEGPVGRLVVDVEVAALVQQDQVVQAVAVHVGDAHASTAVGVGVREDGGCPGEGLGGHEGREGA